MYLRHICESCHKEEVLTPEQGFEQGWDHPPSIGNFKVVSPRTCGNCSIEGTLWWALNMEGKQITDLGEGQLRTLKRILAEPESIVVSD